MIKTLIFDLFGGEHTLVEREVKFGCILCVARWPTDLKE